MHCADLEKAASVNRKVILFSKMCQEMREDYVYLWSKEDSLGTCPKLLRTHRQKPWDTFFIIRCLNNHVSPRFLIYESSHALIVSGYPFFIPCDFTLFSHSVINIRFS
jgi:hypothetical protein